MTNFMKYITTKDLEENIICILKQLIIKHFYYRSSITSIVKRRVAYIESEKNI